MYLGGQTDGVPVRRGELQFSSEDLVEQLLLDVILTETDMLILENGTKKSSKFSSAIIIQDSDWSQK